MDTNQEKPLPLWDIDSQGVIFDPRTNDIIAVAVDRSNSPVIAAAPELLEALKAISTNCRITCIGQDGNWETNGIWAKVEAAISKAEGKQ